MVIFSKIQPNKKVHTHVGLDLFCAISSQSRRDLGLSFCHFCRVRLMSAALMMNYGDIYLAFD